MTRTETERRPMMSPVLFRGLFALAMLGMALSTGCVVVQPEVGPTLPVLFPPPPMPARVQYLGAVSSPLDLPDKPWSLAEFILGPEPVRYVLAKPISAILSGDRLYVCDTVFNSVVVYDLRSGEAHPLAGDRGIGKIRQPNNIAQGPDGRIYVADKIRQAVLIYGPDEQYLDAWGRPGEAQPVDVAVGENELYICDISQHEIEVWSLEDGRLLHSFGGLGLEPGRFFLPTYVTLDSEGNVFVTDTGNFRIQKLSPEGEPLMEFGGQGVRFGNFAWPKGLDVDGSGRIYVADSRFANVQIFDPAGRLLLFFGAPGPEYGNLDLPAGVSVYPWPDLPWLNERLLPDFEPEYVVIVVSQKGQGLVNFFAVAKDPGVAPDEEA